MSSDDRVGAADFRRALALIQHGERGDVAGMRVIVDDEVLPADRLPQLIRATVSVLWQLVAQLCEPDEVAEIGEMLPTTPGRAGGGLVIRAMTDSVNSST